MNFLHECNKAAYLRTYAEQIIPIPGDSEWVEVEFPPIQPPVIVRPPGRLKNLRKKAADEPRSKYSMTRRFKLMHCGKCHKVGHNSRRMRLKRQNVYVICTCFIII